MQEPFVTAIMPMKRHSERLPNKNIKLFNSQKISATVSNFEAVKVTMDKEKTFSRLKEIGINIPNYYKVKNYSEFLTSLKNHRGS